jgi:hypothetical protein
VVAWHPAGGNSGAEATTTGTPTKPHPRQVYPNHLWVYYAVVKRNLIQKVEDDLLAAFLPPFNRKFPAVVKHMVKAVFS